MYIGSIQGVIMSESVKHAHLSVDLGPSTIIVIAELLLVALKLMGHISLSWAIVLSPIILVISGAGIILLFTLIKVLKRYLF